MGFSILGLGFGVWQFRVLGLGFRVVGFRDSRLNLIAVRNPRQPTTQGQLNR